MYLSQVDHIIVLQNGRIAETGRYSELLENEGGYFSFLATNQNEDHKRSF